LKALKFGLARYLFNQIKTVKHSKKIINSAVTQKLSSPTSAQTSLQGFSALQLSPERKNVIAGS
jgi:hypothetical protein